MGLGASTVELRMDFDPFFHAHFEKVARAAALVTRDAGAGQDLAQEAFMRLLERWGTIESDDRAQLRVQGCHQPGQIAPPQARPTLPLRPPWPGCSGNGEPDGIL